MTEASADNFDVFLNDLLPDLDRAYANEHVSLTERPLRAAIFIVEHCILEIEGGTKDDFHQAPWFAALFQNVTHWFEQRYGSLSGHKSADHLSAAVQVYDRWFLLGIPVSYVTPVDPDNTVWAYLPTKLREEEDPLSWFLEGPNTEAMKSSARKRTIERIEDIAGLVRRINLNFWVSFPEPKQAEMAKHIKSHISSAASLFSKNTAHDAQLAIWEMFLGIEKSLKLWLAQKGIPFEEDHDLRALSQKIDQASIEPLLSVTEIDKLPSGVEAVKYRYAELPAPSNERQRQIYKLGLRCIQHISNALERKYQFFDAGFKITQPPWQK